jgi:hypothetical protein
MISSSVVASEVRFAAVAGIALMSILVAVMAIVVVVEKRSEVAYSWAAVVVVAGIVDIVVQAKMDVVA